MFIYQPCLLASLRAMLLNEFLSNAAQPRSFHAVQARAGRDDGRKYTRCCCCFLLLLACCAQYVCANNASFYTQDERSKCFCGFGQIAGAASFTAAVLALM
jgi:hypothetical protein